MSMRFSSAENKAPEPNNPILCIEYTSRFLFFNFILHINRFVFISNPFSDVHTYILSQTS